MRSHRMVTPPLIALDPASLRYCANECAKEARGNYAARDKARAGGRETVALCRESDAEVLTRMSDFFRREAKRIEGKQKRARKRGKR